jgi:hypothetical protein
MMKKILPFLLIFLSGCFLTKELSNLTGSSDDDPTYIKLSSAKQIELQSGELVDIYEEEEESANKLLAKLNKAKKKDNFPYEIRYVARVLPVEVSGLNVQANDIILKGKEAYVSYNYANELFKGAIQLIDVSDEDEPEIIEEIVFEQMDINTLYLDGNTLIFGGAANSEIYSQRSFVGVIENVKKPDVDDIEDSLIFFEHSYGVTAITKRGNNYYISVGAEDGKIYITDKNFNIETTLDKADVRDMEEYKNGAIAIKGTTDNSEDAKIMLIKNNSVVKELELNDFSSDYNKVTIEMYDKRIAFVGMSALGFQVYDVKDSDALDSVFTMANPDNDPKHVTNSVSYDKDLVFIANGEYGVRIVEIKDIDKNDAEFGEKLGFIDFQGLEDENDQNYSANHVAYKSDHLFVASGVGGVNIYTVDDDDDDD